MVAQCILTLNDNRGADGHSRARLVESSKYRCQKKVDLEIRAGGGCFFAHRSVLGEHSSYFRNSAIYANATLCLLKVEVPHLNDAMLRAGWNVIQRYCYGRRDDVDIATALQILPIALEYRFDGLTWILDAHLRQCARNPRMCTWVYASATSLQSRASNANFANSRRPKIVVEIERIAWRVMVDRFDDVCCWEVVPYVGMVRLLKQNDLRVKSEFSVWRAVLSWCENRDDEEAITSLGKLVRFQAMSSSELDVVERSDLVQEHIGLAEYVFDQDKCKLEPARVRSCVVSRPRRWDAISFTDNVESVSAMDGKMETSVRYFCDLLWGVVVHFSDVDQSIGLYLKVLIDDITGTKDVNVAVDFALFITSTDGKCVVKKQANDIRFTRSGQRIGFARIAKLNKFWNLEDDNFDTAFSVGASIRLTTKKGTRNSVFALDDEDNTDELLFL